MAKNVLQAKKRVSHFQKTHKDLDGENELFGCKDFVSSIIQDMDSNFSLIQSGYSKKGIDCNETHFTNLEDSFQSIPILKMPSTSSGNGTLQIPAKHTKTRKISLSRKFPLMEKSQKILKQLKHNQNIPKPRAHLAGIPKSPGKSKVKYTFPKISVAKKKEIMNVKNKVISNPLSKVPSNHCPVLNVKNSNSKSLKDGPTSKHNKPKKTEGNTCGKSSFSDNPIKKSNKEAILETNKDFNKETNEEINSILESDNSTSDSEYEKFLKKSKKGLHKKGSNRQKQNTRKKKPCTRSLKRKISHVSEQKNMQDCDSVTESSNDSTISPFKKQKNLQNDSYFKNDMSCSDDDVPTRDSSSESDNDSIASFKSRQITSKTIEVKPVGETTVLSNANSSLSCLSVLESNINSDLVSSNDETRIVNTVDLEAKHVDETEISSGANLQQSCQNLHFLESNMNKSKEQSHFSSENLLNSIKIERDSLPSNLIIDISDSDDDELNISSQLKNSEALSTSIRNSTKSLADSDSEESDIEMIEEVKTVQSMDKSLASVLANTPDSLKTCNGKQLNLENVCADVKPTIKTEDLDSKSSVNILPLVKNQKEAEINDKHDVVFRTDICHTKIILEQKTVVSSQINKIQNVPSKGSFQANPEPTVFKYEIDSDDEIIVLDSNHSTKVDVSNFSCAKTESIKSEPSTSNNKLKLHDTIDFDETHEWKKKIRDVIPLSSTELLDWYKMEFETLKEMKRANADVEASLKNLQARQTQKLLYVRNLLHKCVDINPLAGSVSLPLAEPPKDSKDLVSAIVQKNCDITPNNSFSLNHQIVSPSNAVQDVKPDVNKLKEGMLSLTNKPKMESIQGDLNSKKCVPKIESDDKQTLKLLDEKCSVCGKDAVAACQRCAKVFFCSHECGRKFWIEGHVKVCGTK